jgi:CRISPR-associated protein Cmr2
MVLDHKKWSDGSDIMTNKNKHNPITTALAWCLAWGDRLEPQFDLPLLQKMRQALNDGDEVPAEVRSLVDLVVQLQDIDKSYFPRSLHDLQKEYPSLWKQTTKVGLVYGGATKIKQYVFEAAKLPDIRGASALLDRINLVDIPAFFGECSNTSISDSIAQWLQENFAGLKAALIPELLVYFKGGNILAFCPVAFVDNLADAIERRYTEETLTANSCAVGDAFKLLEIRFGLLKGDRQFWLSDYLKPENHKKELVEAYFGSSKKADGNTKSEKELESAFKERKNFNELVTQLAIAFNRRRSGNKTENRLSRAYPPMFETHPYLQRDDADRCTAMIQAEGLPNDPHFSEALARKRVAGQVAKRDRASQNWYHNSGFTWKPHEIDSWVSKFQISIGQKPHRYYEEVRSQGNTPSDVDEARSLREISKPSNGFVAYIYADGNNMGGYIQKKIKTPENYKQFSEDIFDATEKSVYYALAQHIKPVKIKPDADSDRQNKNEVWIHPFEIITIGGDDVLLIVPANKALEVAKTIGEKFEEILSQKQEYKIAPDRDSDLTDYQRYRSNEASPSQCQLSTSIGVLIAADNTPIYYAEDLVSQLLKSAKKKAKELKKYGFCGGTVDLLSMKSVTMISSNIEDFRQEGLEKKIKHSQIKLYATPYTLHELGGLIEVVKTLKEVNFPRSQLYQIRSLLEQGKHTAILNYRYFRVRLNKEEQKELKEEFEEAWCKAKTNEGNLAPWMFSKDGGNYETIWREIVDIYDFIEEEKSSAKTTLETGVKS